MFVSLWGIFSSSCISSNSLPQTPKLVCRFLCRHLHAVSQPCALLLEIPTLLIWLTTTHAPRLHLGVTSSGSFHNGCTLMTAHWVWTPLLCSPMLPHTHVRSLGRVKLFAYGPPDCRFSKGGQGNGPNHSSIPDTSHKT